MSNTGTRAVGTQYEKQAVRLLEKYGLRILDTNYHCRQGEIDIVAMEGERYVFVEVKYRSGLQYGVPEEAVSFAKQRKIIHAARVYLYRHGRGTDVPCRFDVITFYAGRVRWLRDAFELTGQDV